VFSARDAEVFRLARALISRVPSHLDRDGREIRCHELARAVCAHLVARDLVAEVIDGDLYSIEHTWILLPRWINAPILDVYTPGRLPQVQLIDHHLWIVRGYEAHPALRSDIRQEVVDDLVMVMTDPASALASPRGPRGMPPRIGIIGPILDEELP
jgi:hypothetical protein